MSEYSSRVTADVLADGHERRVDAQSDERAYHRLVHPPRRTLMVSVNRGRGIEYVEVPDEPSVWATVWEHVTDAGYALALLLSPVLLAAFWVAVSYVVMVVGWVIGAGGLHPFPHLLLVPTSCAPYSDPC